MEKEQRVAIVGKSRDVTHEELEKYKVVLTVGTNPIEADLYLCLHGEGSTHPERDCTWERFTHVSELPYLVNSICILLAHTYYSVGISNQSNIEVDILASPLISTEERVHERVAVAYWVGRLEALGVKVNWEGGMKKTLPYMWEAYAGKGS